MFYTLLYTICNNYPFSKLQTGHRGFQRGNIYNPVLRRAGGIQRSPSSSNEHRYDHDRDGMTKLIVWELKFEDASRRSWIPDRGTWLSTPRVRDTVCKRPRFPDKREGRGGEGRGGGTTGRSEVRGGRGYGGILRDPMYRKRVAWRTGSTDWKIWSSRTRWERRRWRTAECGFECLLQSHVTIKINNRNLWILRSLGMHHNILIHH